MPAGASQHRFPHGWVIVILDASYLYYQLLPMLTQRHFGNEGAGTYHIQVRIQSTPNRVVYDSAPAQPFPAASLKTVTRFSGTLSHDGLSPYARRQQLASADGPWQLAVNRESSPAAAFIEHFRAMSLVISSVSLLVLAAALVTLFLAA